MSVQRFAAFSDGERGGNPAGVMIAAQLPPAAEMQRTAAELGFSETVFAAPVQGGWRVRYFSPAVEIPFCGHATIALGAALALQQGDGVFALTLNDAEITVEGLQRGVELGAALQSPPTRSAAAAPALVAEICELMGYALADLDPRLPAARINAGAEHLVLALRTRSALAAMAYDFDLGQRWMRQHGLVTILMVHAASDRVFDARNAFAYGGVVEDPATGAAAAALGGYLRDLGWPHGGAVEIRQGDDMGVPSRIQVQIGPEPGSSVRVAGRVRLMPSEPA
jgi:PhzF family phenazine biosynthesis protein